MSISRVFQENVSFVRLQPRWTVGSPTLYNFFICFAAMSMSSPSTDVHFVPPVSCTTSESVDDLMNTAFCVNEPKKEKEETTTDKPKEEEKLASSSDLKKVQLDLNTAFMVDDSEETDTSIDASITSETEDRLNQAFIEEKDE